MTSTAFAARRGLAAAALSAALLAACGPDSKPVTSTADAAGQAALAKSAGDPCNEPAGTNYPSPVDPPVKPQLKLSPKALASHKDGCAGLKFQLSPDGRAVNASVVTESPQSFGFGDTALAALKATQFGPGQPKSDYYYSNVVVVQTSAGPSLSRPSVGN